MSLRGSVGAGAPPPRARPPSPLAYEAPVPTATAGAALYSDAVSMQPELLARMRAAHVDSRAPRTDAALTAARLAPPPAGRPRPVFEPTTGSGSIVAQVLGPAPLPMPARFETETETSAPVGLGELGEHDLHDKDTLEHAPTDTSYVSPSVPEWKDKDKAYDLYYTDEDNVPLVVAAWGREAPNARDARSIAKYMTRVRTKDNKYSAEAFSMFAGNVTTRGAPIKSEITATALTNAQAAEGGADPFNTAAVVGEPASMGFGMVGGKPSLAQQELASILAPNSTVRNALDPTTAQWESMFSPKTRPWLASINNSVGASTQRHFSAMAVLGPYVVPKDDKKVWIYAPKSGHGVDAKGDPIKRNYLPDWEWSEISTEERCKLFGCRVVPLHVNPADGPLEYGHCIWIARREFWRNSEVKSFGTTGKAWKSACAQFPCHYIEMHLVSNEGEPYIALLNALALTAACLPSSVKETNMPTVDAYRELGWYAAYRTHQLSEAEADEAVKTAAAAAAALAEERGEPAPPPPPRPPTYTEKAIAGIPGLVKLVEGLPKDVSDESLAAIYTPGRPHVSLAALWAATHLAHHLYNRRLNAKLGKAGIGALVANVLTTDQQVAKNCLPFDPKTKSKTTNERVAEGAKQVAGKASRAAGRAGEWMRSKMPSGSKTNSSCCANDRAELFDARALPQDDGADWSDEEAM